jgi:hypothetical protein
LDAQLVELETARELARLVTVTSWNLGCVWFAFLDQPGPRVQVSGVWLPAPAPEPDSPDAISPLLPASPETPETALSAEPGSAHAVVSLTNDVLVYN